MSPPLDDPNADLADDGGTLGWRARRAPQTVTIYRSRRAAFLAMMRKHPLLGFFIAAIALCTFLALESAGYLIYALVQRVLSG
jgi:hypothetical protein